MQRRGFSDTSRIYRRRPMDGQLRIQTRCPIGHFHTNHVQCIRQYFRHPIEAFCSHGSALVKQKLVAYSLDAGMQEVILSD
jgi:hypothetical protein